NKGKEEVIEVTRDFLPKDKIEVINKDWGSIILWENYEDSCSVSFVNGSQCTGIHQKLVNDWVNEFLDYNLAHHFYETFISFNVPSTLMRFADQNKTKYAASRIEIEEIMEKGFKNKLLRGLKGSSLHSSIIQKIEDRLHNENIRKIKKAQRVSKRKISDKYSPASKIKDTLYITEGLSAAGSVRQARDSEREGVYALKGKVKNTRRLSDLTTNKEILEIMSILGINPDDKNKPSYKKIVIASDEDPDGQHISSLIINFFYKWFPNIIEEGHLYKIVTPLVACDYNKSRKYFYSSEEFSKFLKTKKVTNINYLKGLGSLSIGDWKNVMNNKMLFQIVKDRSANKFLDIAFGNSALKRKKWLEGVK
ncbi:MAG: toprim domain-containing protein, partial [Nanoarchaeota archaeon]